MKTARVLIIIVSYNVSELLQKCLQSVFEQDCSFPLQVVVVDNVSTDDTLARVRENFPQVTLLANQHNVGFAAGNNQALAAYGVQAAAPPPYALLLNPDTVVRPGALRLLHNTMQDHPDLGILGPRIVNPDGSLQSGVLRFPSFTGLLKSMIPLSRGPRPTCPASGLADSDWILGACMMVRGELLRTVGVLDEHYFLYGEEKDWCFRAKRGGWRVAVLGDAEVVHYGGQSTRQVAPSSYETFIDSQVRFYCKHYPALHRGMFLSSTATQTALMAGAARFFAWRRGPREQEWRDRLATYQAGRRRALDYLRGRRPLPSV
jgi:N-acetylglucosaminyl-diphospho-decaprenol L-rhamnosyltransferase